MRKRGKKLDPETQAEIIRLSKDYSPEYIARHLGLHKSTVRKYIELDLETKVNASRSFQKHSDDLVEILKGIVSKRRNELMQAAFTHFVEDYPRYANLINCHGASDETSLLDKMELVANSRSFKFCAKCPICQSIKRQLRKMGFI